MNIKRAFDFLFSAFSLFFLFPFFLLIALLIKLDSSGPIFHRACRVGKNGQRFYLYKFRTMVADAASRGPGITTKNDSRITRIGRVLRRAKLDEFPQLINVVKGEMSLVGPRPEDPRYVDKYTSEQRKVLSLLPGITSVTSVRYRHEEGMLEGENWERVYLETIMPRKLEIELEYLQCQTFFTDLKVLAETMVVLFR